MATTRKDNELLSPMWSSRRGKVYCSDPLNGSDRSVEQNSEYVFGVFGPSMERTLCNGAPLSVTGYFSHTEQNGRDKVEMETVLRGISEVRNRGNSSNIVIRNGD